MSLQEAKAFFDVVDNDPELARQLIESKNKDQCMDIARSRGFTFSEQEIEILASELKDEDLENIAGGIGLHEPNLENSWKALLAKHQITARLGYY